MDFEGGSIVDRLVKKLSKKLCLKHLRSKVKGIEEFNKEISLGHFDLNSLNTTKEKLKPYYTEYVTHVSSSKMAASLELVTCIYTICKLNKWTKLLDMGSGLSSFVFRLYAQETPGVVVYSVDDDAAWLEKTKQYLKQHELETDNMLTLEELIILNESEFDCILHDLNFVEVRINHVELVIRAAKQNGLIIFDDVHKPDYQFALLKKLDKMPVTSFDLKSITLDQYGRYAFAALKK